MPHHVRLDPQKVNELGVANQDSTVLPEFTFHHGHVEQVINTKEDFDLLDLKVNRPLNDYSQMILVSPTFEGVLRSGYLKNKIPCIPLLRVFSDSIARGDSVIYTKMGNIYYYLGPLNSVNNPNYSPDIYYNENKNVNLKSKLEIDNRKDDPNGYNKNYRRLNIRKANKTKIYGLDSPYATRFGDIGSEAELEMAYSDLTLEGRHGNSIQIGSRFVNPYITIKNNNIDSNKGSALLFLSLGSIGQSFRGYDKLSSDRRIEKERETLAEGQYSGYPINYGNDGIGEPLEDTFNMEYGKVQDSSNNQTEFDQVVMFSDRITFDAKENDLTMSAYRNINFGAGRNITFTNKGFTVIESENIYLGKKAKEKTEPMVLGNELRLILIEILEILNSARANVQGVPLPLVDSSLAPLNAAPINVIGTLLQKLNDLDPQNGGGFFSSHHYIEQNRSTNEG